jgi:hypothetical protein
MKRHGLKISAMQLELYHDADLFVSFLAYMRQRGVQSPHLIKHVSIARKMLDFLQSGSLPDTDIRRYTARMDSWLGVLGRQLAASAPTSAIETLPAHSSVRKWAMSKVSMAIQALEYDMVNGGCVRYNTAAKVST